MSQSPLTVTYSLEEILTRIERKIDNLEEKLTGKIDKLEGKIDKLSEEVNNLKIGQARLEEKVEGLSKRVDSQEFISRGILIGLIVTILGGLAKLFGFAGNL